MLNQYLQNLNRIEFVITYACTGQCKHCSEGAHLTSGDAVNGDVAADTVRKIAELYSLESIMTFGGEPLLYPDSVCKIHNAARGAGIPARQLITNGYFAGRDADIQRAAKNLAYSGVNDVLLSVDAFHQETIPLDTVITFAKALIANGMPRLRTHPAWLVSKEAVNPYNDRTRELLRGVAEIGVDASAGNVIFPAGNALKYLSEYIDTSKNKKSPYEENPHDVRSICVSPNGDVLGGNIYRSDITEIIRSYRPMAGKE